MWIWLAIGSALALGFYDVAKKQALKKNGVLPILLVTSLLTTLFLSPFLRGGTGTDHLLLLGKAALVSVSWISGLIAMKLLPITTASTIKASRPMFVVLFSVIVFSEHLNLWQWAGIAAVLAALFLLSVSSRKEGIDFRHNKGIMAMVVSIFAGVASALFDKHIMEYMQPLFVQSWCNLYISGFMALSLLAQRMYEGKEYCRIHWDWTLLLIAVLITGADALYFFALGEEGSMLSVISILRRCSVVVTFICGAIIFKERNLRAKSLELVLLLAGIILLVSGTD